MTIYLIFIIVGCLLLTGALMALKGRLAFAKGAERAVGTLVQLVEGKGDDEKLYYPVFEIHTRQHGIITYRHTTAYSFPKWRIGETATFILEPGKPYTARFLKYWTVFWWPLTLMAVAVDLLVIGGGYFLLRGYVGA